MYNLYILQIRIARTNASMIFFSFLFTHTNRTYASNLSSFKSRLYSCNPCIMIDTLINK